MRLFLDLVVDTKNGQRGVWKVRRRKFGSAHYFRRSRITLTWKRDAGVYQECLIHHISKFGGQFQKPEMKVALASLPLVPSQQISQKRL